jgi:hypothetical protein
VKSRDYSILAKYVPTRHRVDDEGERRQIEHLANISEGETILTRWVKPEDKQSDHQRVAHLIVKVKTERAANQLIRSGAIIAGTRVFARKLKKEPRRCLKCQKLSDHFAAACPADEEVCATCGAAHQTRSCRVDDPQLHWCANCTVHGHASWARTCPIFWHKCDFMAQRDPVSTYHFFPSADEPWTWVQIEHPRPPPTHNTEHGDWTTVGRQHAPPQWHHPTPTTHTPHPNATPTSTARGPPRNARPNTNPPFGSRDRGWGSNNPTNTLDSWVHKRPLAPAEPLTDSTHNSLLT